MGISLNLWRARIGSFSNRCRHQVQNSHVQKISDNGLDNTKTLIKFLALVLGLLWIIQLLMCEASRILAQNIILFPHNCSEIDIICLFPSFIKAYVFKHLWQEQMKILSKCPRLSSSHGMRCGDLSLYISLAVCLEILGGADWIGLSFFRLYQTYGDVLGLVFQSFLHFIVVCLTMLSNGLVSLQLCSEVETFFNIGTNSTIAGQMQYYSETHFTSNLIDVMTKALLKWIYRVLLVLLVIGNVELNPGPSANCSSCAFSSSSLLSHAAHQKIHSAQPNFMYVCGGPTCSWRRYHSYDGLVFHIKTYHSQAVIAAAASGLPSRSCTIPTCTKTVKGGSHALCCHLREHLNLGESLLCPFQNDCGSRALFKTTNHFQSHLSVKHPGWRENKVNWQVASRIPEHDVDDNNDNDDSDVFFDAENLHESDSEEFEPQPEFDAEMFAKHMGQFYLMLLSECFMPESTVQKISMHMKTLSELNQYWYRTLISKALKEEGFEESKITSIVNTVLTKDVFYATHHKEMPGPTLISTYFRDKFYDKHFAFEFPDEVPLDLDREDGEVVHQVRIKKTLGRLFDDPSVNRQIEESFHRKPSNGNIFRDYYDGKVCKDSNLPQERIDLILFQDGFKSSKNPIGSAAKKLGYIGTYFTIGNLKPHIRTKVKSINLALLVKESLVKQKDYGLDKCFKPLVDELKELAKTGIFFNNRVVPVHLQFVCGDNLGAHTIGGYVENFTGHYFCRFCEITKAEFHEDHLLVHNLRSVKSYEEALQNLSDEVNWKGIKRRSPLNDIPNFHVADPRLPVCLAHDLFENGVVSSDFKLMINYFVHKKWFTFDILEGLIDKFKYSEQDVKNKPAPVPNPARQKKESKLKLGGHAVQNWYLLRLFPFIIENRIMDTEDEVWKLFLALKNIVEIVCKPEFTNEDLEELQALSESYMVDRATSLPGVIIKPKYHFFLHYVQMIRLFGPLIYVWTLRFEAKHQFFKRIMRVCNNTINPGWTMAVRHQKWFAYLTSGLIYPSGIQGTPKVNAFEICKQSIPVQESLKSFPVSENTVESTSVVYDDILFKKDSYVILNRDSTWLNHLQVGLIQNILIDHGKTYLILQKYNSQLLRDFGVYQICEEKEIEILEVSSLKFPTPLSVYDFKTKLCFSLKHSV